MEDALRLQVWTRVSKSELLWKRVIASRGK